MAFAQPRMSGVGETCSVTAITLSSRFRRSRSGENPLRLDTRLLGRGENVCFRVFAPTLTLPLAKGEEIFRHAHRLSCESNSLRHHARYL